MSVTLNGEGDMIKMITMNCASILGNATCIGYTVLMMVLGLYTHNYTFIAASMMGIASVAAVSMMNMYCLHNQEMYEKSQADREQFPFCD